MNQADGRPDLVVPCYSDPTEGDLEVFLACPAK